MRLQQIMVYPCENRPLISFDYTLTLAILHMSLTFAKEMLLKVKARGPLLHSQLQKQRLPSKSMPH